MADDTKQSAKPGSNLLNARDDPEWHKERNKRRRERYAKDREYRETVRKTSRKTYREASDSQPFDPRQNLDHLDDFGRVRPVTFPDGRVIDRWCMTKAEAAEVFGRALKLFQRWALDGRFPEAVLTAIDTSTTRDYSKKKGVKVPQRVKVYTAEEIRAAANALGPHLSNVIYYRRDHLAEREKVFAAVSAARTALGIASEG